MSRPDTTSDGLTPRQRREAWARTGQFELLLEELRTLDPSLLDHDDQWQLVLEAIEVRALLDPEAFAGEMLGRLVAFTANLTLRSQFAFQNQLQRHDRESSGSGAAGLPAELDGPLSRLVDLQVSLAGLLAAQAAVARKWKLARGGRPAVKKTRAKSAGIVDILPVDSGSNGHGRHLNGHHRNGAPSNGHTNRLDGKLDHEHDQD